MELPYNTVISQDILKKGATSPIADWATKRRWLNYAFEQFLAHDYEIAGSDIVATKKKTCNFIYRDALWHGGDMIGLGVSSFSHFGGVNFQNAHNFEEYVRIINDDRLPIYRAVSLTPKQRLIREMVLQLKTGMLDTGYFQKKYAVDVWNEFQPVYQNLQENDLLRRDNGTIRLTRSGLLQVDHFLLDFFEPELRTVRYA
jgi:oxygen-independent coproporphyrinogen III oxidase